MAESLEPTMAAARREMVRGLGHFAAGEGWGQDNLTGTIGRDHFTGTGTGTELGKQFEGGTVNLSNSKGTVEFSLAPAVVIKVRKSSRRKSRWLPSPPPANTHLTSASAGA